MGWTFVRGATKEKIVAELIGGSEWTREEDVFWCEHKTGTHFLVATVAHRLVGNSLWYVKETTITAPDGTKVQDRERWIGLALLDCSGGWGYKTMDEAMGPYDVSCPVEFLELAPQPDGEFAGKWRESVRRNGTRGYTGHSLPLFA